jgi:hypothetical protein
MRFPTTLLAAACVLVAVCAAFASAQGGEGVVRVEVTDSSGGRLPGVAVVATGVDGHVLASSVTDRTGRAVFPTLSAGPVMLRFRLEGFTGALVGVTVESGGESRVVQQLDVAPYSETVMVEAPAPVEPTRPSPPPPVPSAPRGPRLKPVPEHDRDAVCGPSKRSAAEPLGTIRSTRYVAQGGLYTSGGQIIVDGGAPNGLEVGQNLVVRRHFRVERLAGSDTMGEHSAGLVQIVAASERSSIAIVVYACDQLRAGDFLATFNPEPVRPHEPRGTPDYDGAARILFADEGQLLGAPRRLMVIDRGSSQSVRVGQRVTLFRRSGRNARGHEIIGDAVVVSTRVDSATIRVERVNDETSAGDLAALHIQKNQQ